jgi:hypothetical protein
MGMFDYVEYSMSCPECDRTIAEFQTKDRPLPMMDTLDPLDLLNFYALCRCGAWIEFVRSMPRAKSFDDFEMRVKPAAPAEEEN